MLINNHRNKLNFQIKPVKSGNNRSGFSSLLQKERQDKFTRINFTGHLGFISGTELEENKHKIYELLEEFKKADGGSYYKRAFELFESITKPFPADLNKPDTYYHEVLTLSRCKDLFVESIRLNGFKVQYKIKDCIDNDLGFGVYLFPGNPDSSITDISVRARLKTNKIGYIDIEDFEKVFSPFMDVLRDYQIQTKSIDPDAEIALANIIKTSVFKEMGYDAIYMTDTPSFNRPQVVVFDPADVEII